MTIQQSILIFVLAFGFFLGVIWLVRSHQFREKYSLLWIGISLLFLSVPFFDAAYQKIGESIGIISMISFLSLCAFLTLFLLMIQVTIALTLAYNQRKEIIQNLALLEARIASIEKRLPPEDQEKTSQ
ncbi:MAG: DUF2304 domain-containing protein [Nitrospirae bacterium]|nr:DUF2304 domain-containing protein [Magnetococcales bacterium]HAT50709.1 hypothetical protein [Alphaproteobacteria bacterium]